MSDKRDFVATCRPGLEGVLEQELQQLGVERIEARKRAVHFVTDLAGLYRVNMALRSAVQVLQPLRTFNARDYDLLYHQCRRTNWHQLFNVDKQVRIDVSGTSSQLRNTQYVVHRIKDAIVDTFKKLRDGQRPSIDKQQPDFHVVAHLRGDKVTLCLDSSGQTLFKRGYRTEHGEAPIKEDLAAGILLCSGFGPGQALVDPMCGSGTFLFEGWMISRGIAPNLRRHFAFENWLDYDAQVHEHERAALDRPVDPALDQPALFGSDLNPEVVALAESIRRIHFPNAKIQFRCVGVNACAGDYAGGLMVVNPPYGERLGNMDILGQLYRELGLAAKRMVPGGRLSVFTTNRAAARQIRLQQDRSRTLFNGSLEGVLYEYAVRAAQ